MSAWHGAGAWRLRKALLCSHLINGYFCRLQFRENQEGHGHIFTAEIPEIIG